MARGLRKKSFDFDDNLDHIALELGLELKKLWTNFDEFFKEDGICDQQQMVRFLVVILLSFQCYFSADFEKIILMSCQRIYVIAASHADETVAENIERGAT